MPLLTARSATPSASFPPQPNLASEIQGHLRIGLGLLAAHRRNLNLAAATLISSGWLGLRQGEFGSMGIV